MKPQRSLLHLFSSLIILTFFLKPLISFAYLDILPKKDIQFINNLGNMVNGTRCASQDSTDPSLIRFPDNISSWRSLNPKRAEKVTIPIAFHIIQPDANTGKIEDWQLLKQTEALDKAFAAMNIDFEIKSINRIRSSFHYNISPGIQEFFMKLKYNKDPANTLNFYIGLPVDGILGFATFPWMYPENSFMHGVVVRNDTLPPYKTITSSQLPATIPMSCVISIIPNIKLFRIGCTRT